MDETGIDITGPFVVAPSTQRYIVAAIDYTSKFAAIHSCADITSSSIMQWLDNLFSEFGLPQQIVTDNSRQFVSEIWSPSSGQRHSSSSYNAVPPWVERFGGVFQWYFKTQDFIRDGAPWNEGLHRLLVNYRGTPHGSDAKSPGGRMFGRTFQQPHQVVPSTQHLSVTQSPSLFASNMSAAPRSRMLQVGEEVLLRDLRPSVGKGEATWRPTPYTILRQNNNTYTLVPSHGR